MRIAEKPVTLLALLSLVLYALPLLVSSKITVTDEVGLDLFSTLVAEHGQLQYEPRGDRIFGTANFVPGQVVYNPSGQAVPRQPPGFILLAGLVKTFTPEGWHIFLNPLLAVLCVLVFYSIAKTILHSDKAAYHAALILATTPVFIHWSQMFFADMANLLAFLLALRCLQATLARPDTANLVFLGAALGAMVWIRQSSLVLVLAMFVYFLYHRHQISWKGCVVPAAVFAVCIIVFSGYNYSVYGNPFMTGHGQAEYLASERTVFDGIINTLDRIFRKQEFLGQRVLWFLPSFSLAFPPLVLALAGLYFALRSAEYRPMALLVILLFTVMFLLVAGRHTYGTLRFDMTLQSSYLRYMLPVIALLPIPTVWALEKFKLSARRWISLIVLLNLGVAHLAHFGVIHTLLVRLYMEDVTEFVVSNTPERSVVVSPYWNHIIYPERLVYSPGEIEQEVLDKVINGILSSGYDVTLINHQSDPAILDSWKASQAGTVMAGPAQLHTLLQLLPVPIPSHVYPVTVVTIPGSSPAADMARPSGH